MRAALFGRSDELARTGAIQKGANIPPSRSQIAPEASGRASPAEVAAEVAGAVIRPRDRVIFRSPIGQALCRN